MNAAPAVAARAAGLVPRRLWVGGEPPDLRCAAGTILFADIVGFTRLTAAARRRHGPRGIEELTRQLNTVFAAMVTAVHAAGGDVLKFGGDALMVAFDQQEQSGDRTLHQAIWCADRLQRAVRLHRAAGGRGLSLHLGLASGSWEECVVGVRGQRREHFVFGRAIREAMAAAAAASGSVCRLHTHRRFVPRDTPVGIHPVGANQWALSLPRRPWQPEVDISHSCSTAPEWLWDFVPTLLRDQLQQPDFEVLGAAEHRRVCTLFAFWRGQGTLGDSGDHLDLWRDVFTLVHEASQEAGGLWARSDPGDSYQKLLILFGAPTNADDDIERALACALKLRDGFSRLRHRHRGLRTGIGLTTATVFTGYVGGAQRHEFTAMGDGVNLAARLAAKAPVGTVLVERATRFAARGFHFTHGAELTLKGITKPVGTYRLRERLAQGATTDEDGVVEHPHAFAECLRLWEETPPRPLRIDICPEADGRRFLTQLLSRLDVDQKALVHLRFEPTDGLHPHGGLRRFLLHLTGCAAPEQLQAQLAALGCSGTWDVLGPVFGSDATLARELARAGLQSWSKRIAATLTSAALPLPGDRRARLIVLEQAHHVSGLDQDVFERLATSPGNDWRFIIGRRRQGHVEAGADGTVALGPAAKQELRAFIQQLLPRGSVSSPLLDFLHERSGGMARVARVYWEDLRDRGLLVEPHSRNGLWRLGDVAATDLPAGLRAHYIQRIDHLPPAVATVARALAVLGESAPEEALGHLCLTSMAHDDLRRSLTALKQTGLVEETPGADGTSLAFADPLCRQAVYETLSYATRENWHRQAAQYWRNQGPVGAQIAGEHLFRARDRAALPLLERAARRARRLWLLDRARSLSRWALLAAAGRCDPEYARIVPPLAKTSNARERRLLRLLAEVLQIQGLYADAGRIWRHLAVDAREHGDAASESQHRLAAARVDWFAGRYQQTRRQATQVLRLKRECTDPRLAGQAYFLIGETARRTGRMAAAQAALTEAVREFDRAHERTLAADAGNALGLVHWHCGRLDRARECFETALRLNARSHDPTKRAQIANNLGILLEESGRLTAAERYYRKAFTIFERLGARRNRAYSLGNLANLYRHGARYEGARAAYEEVELELRSIGEAHAAAYTTGNLGDLAGDFGDWPTAIDLYQRTLRFANHVGDAELLAESYARLAQMKLRQDRHADAVRFLQKARRAARKAQSREFTIRVGLLHAEIALASANHLSALDRFRSLNQDAEAAGLVYYQLWAQYGCGCCLLACDDRRAALATARRGLAHARQSGYRWWELRFAVLGAQTVHGPVSGSDFSATSSHRLLARAWELKSNIESTIGDPAVRTLFAELPLIRRLLMVAAPPTITSHPQY